MSPTWSRVRHLPGYIESSPVVKTVVFEQVNCARMVVSHCGADRVTCMTASGYMCRNNHTINSARAYFILLLSVYTSRMSCTARFTRGMQIMESIHVLQVYG